MSAYYSEKPYRVQIVVKDSLIYWSSSSFMIMFFSSMLMSMIVCRFIFSKVQFGNQFFESSFIKMGFISKVI